MATRKMAPAPLASQDNVEFKPVVKEELPEFPMDEADFQEAVMKTLIRLSESAISTKKVLEDILKQSRAGRF